MDDFQLGLLVLGGLALVGGLAVAVLVLTKPPKPTITKNEETWEWTDWQGRKRTLTAYRKVQSSGEQVFKL